MRSTSRLRIRRLWLSLVVVMLAADWRAVAQSGTPASPAVAPKTEIRGVWLTANDMPVLRDQRKLRQAMTDLAGLGFNTLYLVAWNDGMAYYPSGVVRQRGIQDFDYRGLQGQDVLADLIAVARPLGMLVMPWFEFGFMVPLESDLARRHPTWLTRKRDGGLTSISAAGEVAWLNPFRPEVQQLITDLVLELSRNYPIDGIQFDDHMSLPRAFGYDPFTVALYRKETGQPPPNNEGDGAWLQWRANKITAFMKRLKLAMRQTRPGILLSVSPNYYGHAYKLQLQDWLSWVRQGIADELLIQIYRDDLPSFVEHLDRPEVRESAAKVPVAMAVMAGQRGKPAALQTLQQQVEATRNSGLGVGLFYLESLWSLEPALADQRKAALAALFAQPAPRRSSPGGEATPPVPSLDDPHPVAVPEPPG
ncbi:MAG: family 10 glycosylhydrolase [Cyanobacteriota bacterium]|nr:family 10 glycosylhydrolase [Cyanobacteriota bacterium]